MQKPIIQFDHVSRRFGGRDALKGVDFQVPAGIIAGLIGPNGSGKTTLLKLMAGFIKTTSGAVRLFGYDPFAQRAEVMRRARFAFAPPAVYGSLTAREHLKFLSASGMRQHERPRRSVLIGRATEVLMSRFPDHLKILAGDLNLDIDIDKRRDLFSDDEYLDVETYNYIAQHLSDVTLNTGSTAEPDRRLDYIFTDGKRLKVVHSGPWKGKRVADMDHDPVVADLQIERTP